MEGQYQYYQYQRQDGYAPPPRKDYDRQGSYDQTVEYQETYYEEGHSSPQIGRSQRSRKKRSSNRSDDSSSTVSSVRKRKSDEPSLASRFGSGIMSYIIAPMITGVAIGFGLRLGRTIFANFSQM